MMLQDKLRKTTVAAAAALAMTLGAGITLAQPGGAAHGPHGHGAPGDMIGHLIAGAKDQLNLNTSQQQMFDAAVASTKAAHETGLSLHESVKNALTAELAKSEPDLAAVAAVTDNAQAQGQALRKSVRSAVARALCDVLAGSEGGREANDSGPDGEGRIVPREDEGAVPRQARHEQLTVGLSFSARSGPAVSGPTRFG